MKLRHRKAALAAAWVLAICAMGVGNSVASASGWAMLAGIGLIPSIVMLRLWMTPPQSISESIREAIR